MQAFFAAVTNPVVQPLFSTFRYALLADFESYIACQERVSQLYTVSI